MKDKRQKRHRRIRAKIKGTAKVPRLYVFRSNKHIYGQLIDDEKGKTLLTAKDLEIKPAASPKGKQAGPPASTQRGEPKSEGFGGKLLIAQQVGKLIAERAIKAGIKKVVFDRGGFRYHGRVKALAEGAREGGLKF